MKPIFEQVSADKYEAKYGIRPRGERYWVFEFRGGQLADKRDVIVGLYRDAKREALAKAAQRGHQTVRLIP